MEQTPIETVGRRSPMNFLRQSKVARSISTLLLASTAYGAAYRAQEIAVDPQIQYEVTSSVDDQEEPIPTYNRPTLTELQRAIFILELKEVEQFLIYLEEHQAIPYDPELWYSLHDCEQPNTWHAGGYFGNGLKSSGSGLGMSMDAWHMAVAAAAERGVTLPESAFEASIDEQMLGAQAFKDKHGWGWGCDPYEG